MSSSSQVDLHITQLYRESLPCLYLLVQQGFRKYIIYEQQISSKRKRFGCNLLTIAYGTAAHRCIRISHLAKDEVVNIQQQWIQGVEMGHKHNSYNHSGLRALTAFVVLQRGQMMRRRSRSIPDVVLAFRPHLEICLNDLENEF